MAQVVFVYVRAQPPAQVATDEGNVVGVNREEREYMRRRTLWQRCTCPPSSQCPEVRRCEAASSLA